MCIIVIINSIVSIGYILHTLWMRSRQFDVTSPSSLGCGLGVAFVTLQMFSNGLRDLHRVALYDVGLRASFIRVAYGSI